MTAPNRHGQHLHEELCNHCATPRDLRIFRAWVVSRVPEDTPPVHLGLRAEQCPQMHPHQIGGDAA